MSGGIIKLQTRSKLAIFFVLFILLHFVYFYYHDSNMLSDFVLFIFLMKSADIKFILILLLATVLFFIAHRR